MIEISTDKSLLDIPLIQAFLTKSYWAKGRNMEEVERSIKHCLCFGVYFNKKQIGFARVLTDYTVFVYLMDVFVLPEYRGRGYSKLLMQTIQEHPDLQSCSTWMLKTSDSHFLYKKYGFTELSAPEKVMEKLVK